MSVRQVTVRSCRQPSRSHGLGSSALNKPSAQRPTLTGSDRNPTSL
eukprot:COSAG04_NODE_267_length_18528_cov_60.607141_5_plen_46_part_00